MDRPLSTTLSRSATPTLVVPPPAQLYGRVFNVTSADVTVETDPFALRFIPDRNENERITKQVHGSCARYTKNDHSDDPVKWCAVRRTEGHWSRAETLCCYSDEDGFATEAEVLFIDDGSREIVPITRIFPLDVSLLVNPPQSIRVIPDGLRVTNVKEAYRLFYEHPEMKIRIRIKSSGDQIARSDRPHANALKCTIEVSHDESIDFGELCQRLNIGSFDDEEHFPSETRQAENRSCVERDNAANTANSESDAGICMEPNANLVASASIADEMHDQSTEETPPLRADSEASDEFVSAPDQYGTPGAFSDCDADQDNLIRPSKPNTNDNSDLDDHLDNAQANGGDLPEVDDPLLEDPQFALHKIQEDREIRRGLQQAEKTKAKNERKLRPCKEFNRNGQCSRGVNCSYLHEKSTIQHVVQLPSSIMVECLSIELNFGDTVFAMVSHVDETFYFYVILVYGHRSIWDVLSEKTADTINVEQIQKRLFETYEPLRTSGTFKARALSQGQMVCVWLDDDGEFAGWHRGKLTRTETSTERTKIFLVDHGREAEASPYNVFKLDPEFLEWPMQAIRCRLADTQPKYGVSSEAVMRRLWSRLFILQVNFQSNQADVVVNLFTECGTQSISEELVRENLLVFDS